MRHRKDVIFAVAGLSLLIALAVRVLHHRASFDSNDIVSAEICQSVRGPTHVTKTLITDANALRELVGCFHDLGCEPESQLEYGYYPRLTIEFRRRNGATVHVSIHPAFTSWNAGRGEQLDPLPTLRDLVKRLTSGSG
jgi:hypothetical protein